MYFIDQTSIEGKQASYGEARPLFERHHFVLGGNWSYDNGAFDRQLQEQGNETIYVRVPFEVVEGELDEDRSVLRFTKPYVIKHVVQEGTTQNEEGLDNPMFNQFQEPVDQDASLDRQWVEKGRSVVEAVSQEIP